MGGRRRIDRSNLIYDTGAESLAAALGALEQCFTREMGE
jgi:hypothetical protein